MSATITLPPEVEQKLARKAAAEGIGIEQFAVDVLRRVAEMTTLSELFAEGLNGSSANASLHPNQRWLQLHQEDYRGQWVVLYQGKLIAHGNNGEAVTKEARAQGITEPFLAFIPSEDLPFAGF
jgi:2-oxoglutarate dehydrogenase complex dehydrogenase (E1) component-like enzyme